MLLEVLLQLAPAHIQVMASMADQWIASVNAGLTDTVTKPIGGMTDSCYMWRADGALLGSPYDADKDL